jgi:hypothetical protein
MILHEYCSLICSSEAVFIVEKQWLHGWNDGRMASKTTQQYKPRWCGDLSSNASMFELLISTVRNSLFTVHDGLCLMFCRHWWTIWTVTLTSKFTGIL